MSPECPTLPRLPQREEPDLRFPSFPKEGQGEVGKRLLTPLVRGGLRAGRRVGFTLIEISIVLVILVIIAAAIVPNLVAITRSRSVKDLEGSIARLPTQARNDAVTSNLPVQLRIQGTQIVMERVQTDGSSPQQVGSVDLGTTVTVDSVQLNGQTSNPGSWTWIAYPDGSSDRGTIQFSEGAVQKTLILPSGGDARWITGPAPDQTQDEWPAGQLQQRS